MGDDCAAVKVPPGEVLLVSSDTAIAGRHFFEDADPRDIGHKTLACNLSDLAAMGATARWVTLALSLPEVDATWLDGFCEGFFALADAQEVCLIGGDTTRGPLSITITAMGTTPEGHCLTRGGARPGDRLALTGTVGDAGLALAQALGQRPPRADWSAGWLRGRLDRPTPRLREGRLLRDRATAAIDISDGLAQDLGHVLRQSGVGATVDLAALPLSAALLAECGPITSWRDEDWLLPLASGDDYELLCTLPPESLAALEGRLDLRVIGEITSRPGLRLVKPDRGLLTLEKTGHDHFA